MLDAALTLMAIWGVPLRTVRCVGGGTPQRRKLLFPFSLKAALPAAKKLCFPALPASSSLLPPPLAVIARLVQDVSADHRNP